MMPIPRSLLAMALAVAMSSVWMPEGHSQPARKKPSMDTLTVNFAPGPEYGSAERKYQASLASNGHRADGSGPSGTRARSMRTATTTSAALPATTTARPGRISSS